MKLPGALKLEIIKPLDCTWDEAGQRMRALASTVGEALNETERELWPDLQGALQAVREGDKKRATERKQSAWRRSRKILKQHWNAALTRRASFMKKDGDRLAAPVLDEVAAATETMLQSRWEGEHFKDLLRGKSSVPSWFGMEPFYTSARTCSIGGKPDEAVLSFPLWGAGKKTTRFAVAPCGGSARALWNKMVMDLERRGEVVQLERAAKGPTKAQRATMSQKDQAAADKEKTRAVFSLEELAAHKLGTVGITYNKRKRKWYALISWTQTKADKWRESGQAAAVNFGVNCFIQALAEDGTVWDVPGDEIIATRSRFSAMRRSIARSMRFFGSGAHSRGVKRREQALTKRQGAEQRWTQTKVRTIAFKLIAWCERHGISELYLEDMKGMRESFEDQTGGEAHEQVKRYIHSWPWRETQQAIERQANEVGTVRVFYKSAAFDSQRCPGCDHTDPDNVKIQDRQGMAKDMIVPNPADPDRPFRYRQVARMSWFECKNCGLKGKGDVITCANHLVDVGKTHALHKAQEKSRKRASAAVRERVPKTGTKKGGERRDARKPSRRVSK